MVMCGFCAEWYHTNCVNTTVEEVEKQGSFICEGCTSRTDVSPICNTSK